MSNNYSFFLNNFLFLSCLNHIMMFHKKKYFKNIFFINFFILMRDLGLMEGTSYHNMMNQSSNPRREICLYLVSACISNKLLLK